MNILQHFTTIKEILSVVSPHVFKSMEKENYKYIPAPQDHQESLEETS